MSNRYKLKIKEITPNIDIESLYNKNCFYGISINNPFTWGKHNKLLLEWISQNFSNCIIIIVDYLHRINEQIFFNKNKDDAIEKSMLLGKLIENRFTEDMPNISSNKIKIVHWCDYIESNPKYQLYYNSLKSTFKNDLNFQSNIQYDSKLYVERLISRGESLFLSKEEAIHKSNLYILEELALISCLIENSYTISIYPGTQLNILKELANGNFPDIDTNLNNGIYIDLTVKKIK